jgi:hypothetical protein
MGWMKSIYTDEQLLDEELAVEPPGFGVQIVRDHGWLCPTEILAVQQAIEAGDQHRALGILRDAQKREDPDATTKFAPL